VGSIPVPTQDAAEDEKGTSIDSVAKTPKSSHPVTYPGKPVTIFDLPEPQNPAVSFTYNFWTYDETISSDGRTIGMVPSAPAYERRMFNNTRTYPRWAQITWDPVFIDPPRTYVESDLTLPQRHQLEAVLSDPNTAPATREMVRSILLGSPLSIGNSLDVKIIDHLAEIMYEDAMSNAWFSGVTMQDTGVDTSFYVELNSTIQFFSRYDAGENSMSAIIEAILSGDTSVDITDVVAGANTALEDIREGASLAPFLVGVEVPNYVINNSALNEILNSLVNPSVYSGFTRDSSWTQGKFIEESLADVQAEGLRTRISDTDPSEGVSRSLSEVKNIEFSFNINNLYAGIVVLSAAEDRTGVFNDEILYLIPKSQNLQRAAIINSTPGRVDIDDYSYAFLPVTERLIPAIAATPKGEYNEASTVIGYLVEKWEILEDGKKEYREPLVIQGPSTVSVLDTAVRYGAIYEYKIRTVALSQFEALRFNGNKIDHVVVAEVVVASRGSSRIVVQCIDDEPPAPPWIVDFMWDYERENLVMVWDFPTNPQRDIKKFQIFRRKTIQEPFELLQEYDFDNSIRKTSNPENVPKRLIKKMKGPSTIYVDRDFNKFSKFIYAVCAIDAHGLTSGYSMQYEIAFDIFKNKIIENFISESNAPKPYPNLYLDEDTFKDTMKVSGYENMTVYFDPEYSEVFDAAGDPLNLIAMDANTATYKLSVINCDLQQSKIINFTIPDNREDMSLLGPSYARIRTLSLESEDSDIPKKSHDLEEDVTSEPIETDPPEAGPLPALEDLE